MCDNIIIVFIRFTLPLPDTGEAFDRALSPIYEPIDITAEIAKRNKTTDLDDDKAEAKEEYEVCDFLDEDNVLRQKKFKVFGSNSRRGSSKVLCSQISVSFIFDFIIICKLLYNL